MIKFFSDYCNQLFPSIDTEVKNAVRNSVSQINMSNRSWFTINLLEELSQGDIINKLPFNKNNDDGTSIPYLTKGIVLSNTCDLKRDDDIIIAPLFDIELGDFKESQVNDLKDNVYSSRMCFKNSCLDNYFVDFSQSISFNRKLIMEALEKEKIKRERSLSQLACYFLYTKLTIYYMRIENHEWFEIREKGI